MTLDELMNQYGSWGLHDLDIDLVITDSNGETTVYAYFTEMGDNGKPIGPRGLIVKGKFTLLSDEDIEDKNDISTHCTYIEKAADGTYGLCSVGDGFDFSVDSDLDVTVFPYDEKYVKLVADLRKKHGRSL